MGTGLVCSWSMTNFFLSYNYHYINLTLLSSGLSMVFGFKTLTDMCNTKRLLSLLLALLLGSSNVAFSAHFPSHSATDSGFCSLCFQSGGTDTAISNENGACFVTPTPLTLKPAYTPSHCLPLILHVQKSRAPPSSS